MTTFADISNENQKLTKIIESLEDRMVKLESKNSNATGSLENSNNVFEQNKKYALISVFDKSGVVDFARSLTTEFGFEIISTGGTAKELHEASIPYIPVSKFTGFPEMFDGRVKTLHPKIFGGLLQREKDSEEAKQHQIPLISVVAVNLYPFQQVVAKAETSMNEALEMIDIGGVGLIRAAAKGYQRVTVICNTKNYDLVLQEMRANKGSVSEATRMELARQVFLHTTLYDSFVANFFSTNVSRLTQSLKQEDQTKQEHKISDVFPETLVKIYKQVERCRYGENWDQDAAYYVDLSSKAGLQNVKQLHGKEISFNNYLDIDSCMQMLLDFGPENFVTCILKHNTPNGVAIDFKTQLESCKRAFSTDPLSAFGGIWGFNTKFEKATADFIINKEKIFVEVLIAPEFDEEALAILKSKKDIRIIAFGDLMTKRSQIYETPEIRSVLGGALLEDYDHKAIVKEWVVKTKRAVSDQEKFALIFAYRVSKWAKSNSAAFAKEYETGVYTLGIGAGQQSRVHVVKLAAQKAKEFNHDLKDSVMGTDSFFPFPDGLEASVEAGAKAIINPGGSVKDNDVAKRADELGASLVFCGKRVFRH